MALEKSSSKKLWLSEWLCRSFIGLLIVILGPTVFLIYLAATIQEFLGVPDNTAIIVSLLAGSGGVLCSFFYVHNAAERGLTVKSTEKGDTTPDYRRDFEYDDDEIDQYEGNDILIVLEEIKELLKQIVFILGWILIIILGICWKMKLFP